MQSAPAQCRPTVPRGRPRKEDNAMLELQVRRGELMRAMFTMGPALRRLSCSENQMVRADVRLVVASLAKFQSQAEHRENVAGAAEGRTENSHVGVCWKKIGGLEGPGRRFCRFRSGVWGPGTIVRSISLRARSK